MLNIKNIIKSASKMLGIEELNDLTDVELLDERAKKIVDDMLYCFNEVYQELCCDYFPLIIQEKVNVSNKYLYFDNLSKDINKLYGIYDESQTSFSFDVFSNFVCFENDLQEVTVRYSYVPDWVNDITNVVECNDLGVTERMVALGVATEYCMLRGKFTESAIFDRRYKDSIECAKIPTRRMYLKHRPWF